MEEGLYLRNTGGVMLDKEKKELLVAGIKSITIKMDKGIPLSNLDARRLRKWMKELEEILDEE